MSCINAAVLAIDIYLFLRKSRFQSALILKDVTYQNLKIIDQLCLYSSCMNVLDIQCLNWWSFDEQNVIFKKLWEISSRFSLQKYYLQAAALWICCIAMDFIM